jgi:hypothetical protein
MLTALLKTMRPRQWVTKNVFIFAALVFDKQFGSGLRRAGGLQEQCQHSRLKVEMSPIDFWVKYTKM